MLLAAGLAAALVTTAEAQRPRLGARGAANARVQSSQDSVDRARLEGEVRRGFGRAVRQRVGLSNDQIARLIPLSQRYEQRRRGLQLEERETRMSLRALLLNEATPDQKQVDQLQQRLLSLQKRRVELLETEQRDLAEIMTPVQRAKYMALQEQIRRRLEQMRQRRMPPDSGAPLAAPLGQRPLR